MDFEPVESPPLRAGRFVPFFLTLVVPLDLTNADFAMQVRDRWNGGAIRADLVTQTTLSAEGIKLESVDTTGEFPESTLKIRINETTMEAMPKNDSDPDADVTLVFDFHLITDNTPAVLLRGPFIVTAGSTE
ncbi:hypothetical protein HME9302_00015 [Alteripontixanthobacter maritimus]|uniref:Uncharacterized protein n=1 Tax=Alteripontixanthobacter maritimus TaxID=2161824 RepID=A0A369QPB1_9SPHN|nr:hypothetical protein [Alteripontixanthobacter maritimus]RDC59795.1 hypothetical protein HME9302_00990 [Alteripontixanthobacter maritimus]RDC66564.1 hypothetical protein HME9302_00015 [Alteripontixanthobacter maritimus]